MPIGAPGVADGAQPRVTGSRSGAEERPADPDHRGPLLHRDLEVVAHAHRQLGEPERRRPARAGAANQRRGSSPGGGTAMRPATSRPSARSASTSARHRRRAAAALLRLLRQVHLDEHPGARRPPGDLGAELGAVDRLPARDPRRERAHLVALQLPEEVPTRRGALEHRGLGEQLLGPVLARRRRRPASTTCWTTGSTATVLVAATSVIAAGSRPRACRGRGDARPRPRRPRGRDDVGRRLTRRAPRPRAWRPVVPSRRCGEVVGRRRGAHVDVGRGRRPRPARATARTAAGTSSAGVPVDGRAPTTSGPSRATAGRAGRPELVVRRVDARPEHRRGPGRRPTARRRGDRGARSRPPRGRASRRARPPTPPGATSAIGAQSAVRTTSGRPTAVVTAASASGGCAGRGVDGDDVGAVHLAQPDPRAGIVGNARAGAARREPAPVLGDRVGLVADVVAEVERCRTGAADTPPSRSVKTDPGARRTWSRSISDERSSPQELGHVELVVAVAVVVAAPSRSRCRRRGRRRRRRARAR